ncbi:PLD nuclease N-terminal domain-containing protein [Brevibacterium sp. JSBI002]|uniref:PLD nuclease N-terminal domain-containing protein n=1 Tax=Brevibacterium sp. JSBI002 TaxID=2886045 RepID=UPI00222E447A|nr:PLD nuclease N-terminal domain-containing protein [Brevibacterium sp. JSBI002]UZD63113.1 PLD nuclease N-terminal domain-containing protein [Brevibacterium sp. JSBI002]
MARLLIAAIVLAAAVTLYGLFDCLLRDRGLIRVLPKPVWALIILFIPVLGFILWYLFGRGSEDKPTRGTRPRGQVAPDDDPDYLRQVDRELKLGKHAPPAQDDEKKPPRDDSAKPDDDGDPADSSADTSADSDDRGTKGDGRGRSN